MFSGTRWTTQRWASTLAPRKYKYRKAHKGRIPVNTGGSTKGTTMVFGRFGIRLNAPARLSAKQLEAVTKAIKRKIKVIKGSQIWLRVFPDIPVTKKGNETRMGKGKGPFDYWACRVPINRILLELDAPGMRVELAREAVKLGIDKLPVKAEFVIRPVVVEEALKVPLEPVVE